MLSEVSMTNFRPALRVFSDWWFELFDGFGTRNQINAASEFGGVHLLLIITGWLLSSLFRRHSDRPNYDLPCCSRTTTNCYWADSSRCSTADPHLLLRPRSSSHQLPLCLSVTGSRWTNCSSSCSHLSHWSNWYTDACRPACRFQVHFGSGRTAIFTRLITLRLQVNIG